MAIGAVKLQSVTSGYRTVTAEAADANRSRTGDDESDELFVHTVDDEGFVCDMANEMSQPPPYAYWVRFTDVREARATEGNKGDSPQM